MRSLARTVSLSLSLSHTHTHTHTHTQRLSLSLSSLAFFSLSFPNVLLSSSTSSFLLLFFSLCQFNQTLLQAPIDFYACDAVVQSFTVACQSNGVVYSEFNNAQATGTPSSATTLPFGACVSISFCGNALYTSAACLPLQPSPLLITQYSDTACSQNPVTNVYVPGCIGFPHNTGLGRTQYLGATSCTDRFFMATWPDNTCGTGTDGPSVIGQLGQNACTAVGNSSIVVSCTPSSAPEVIFDVFSDSACSQLSQVCLFE